MKSRRRGYERRESVRHLINIPFKYQVQVAGRASQKKKIKGESHTLNLSRGGFLFAAQEPIPEHSVLKVKIPFQTRTYQVHVKVMHCKQDRKENAYLIGVEFQDVSDAFRMRLIEQMYLITEYWQLRKRQLGRDISLPEASREWVRRYSQKFQKLYW